VPSPAIEVTHDDFDQLLSTSWPNADSVSMTYADANGVLVSVALPNESILYGYDAATGQLTSAARGDEELALNYSGSLLTSVRWSGTIDGTVSFGYDDAGRLVRDRFGTTVEFAYDDDDLLVAAGAEQITRDPETGLVAATQLDTLAEAFDYNAYGELIEHAVSAGASELYARDETRDGLGRVVARTETVLGEATELDYEYDARGRLIEVTTDGLVTASYTYDGNGNRLSVTRGAATVFASYDAQDRLIAHGALSFAHDARGNVVEKVDGDDITSYSYDALGALSRVTMPDARVIDYVVDASGRRIGKKLDGEVVQELLYRSDLAPIGERDENGDVARFVYASHVNVPDYMEKGAALYRLVTDQLGSVRLVVNAATGAVAQRIDYDEFGRVLADSAPGFQPFGFAGGLYDTHTGLVRFGARDYDATTGRWTAKDPALFDGGDANLYAYAYGDPLNYVDPDGEIAFFVAAIGLSVFGEAAAGAALWTAALLTAGIAGGIAAIIINQSKARDEREGDGTRGKTYDEIREAFKDKLTPGQVKKLIEKVQKIRGERNRQKRGGDGGSGAGGSCE
jgi:RHS repeat-associated protein